ncbi:hypothetical protein IEO21_06620 [Rhodonia placenta]|uniref:Uncharacterized protein n=1 Tax=Rhodonia placenta TaxID=104341 RepID=A0A8H7P043_9APHY|nr:hypothetical protein IEO21_06620 [Postia placenta]
MFTPDTNAPTPQALAPGTTRPAHYKTRCRQTVRHLHRAAPSVVVAARRTSTTTLVS